MSDESIERYFRISLPSTAWTTIIMLLHDDAKFACEDEDWDTAYDRLGLAKSISFAMNRTDLDA